MATVEEDCQVCMLYGYDFDEESPYIHEPYSKISPLRFELHV